MKKVRINEFKPYARLFRGNSLNDYIQFQIYWCNYLGFKFTVFGYGFDVGALLFNVSKERKEEK